MTDKHAKKIGSSPRPSRARHVALRLGRTRPGGSRPPPDLYRSGDLRRRDDAYLRRGLGLCRPREPDRQERRLHHHAAGPAADHPVARLATAKSARCSTAAPIAARRYAARTRARRGCSPAPITAGAISTPASCARCRGRTAMPAISRTRSSTSRRCRASTAIAASSSRRSISMRRRCSTISAPSPSRSTNGSTASPRARSRCARQTGSSTRATGSSPTTIPATAITSCSRTARCWRWRTARPTSPTRA